MKASDIVNEKKDGQPGGIKSQFDMQRDEAISELQGTASKQKFQKPNKHLVDKEITDIMDEGFSQTDAEYAMKRFKNPQKALKFLKESKNRQDGKEVPRPPVERKDRRRKGKGMDDEEEQDVPVEYRCPTKSTSLFAFIETKIKTDPEKPAQTNGPASRGHGDRSRDLEDGMGRLNIKESSESYSSYSRSDRGGRGGRGYRGRGDRGGGGITVIHITTTTSLRKQAAS
ncbi:Condensin complex subunit 1 [Orchesella cincta]|uniref:Condensin complex subunit 1 n=1 Tax=Orchesella cincta TaxID=48709 RepID=A0A1D2MUX8_ORCCI|nr:Condensin complex subunit 1 [Orchesella cincta]